MSVEKDKWSTLKLKADDLFDVLNTEILYEERKKGKFNRDFTDDGS